jgi:hypothetical protein
MSALVWATIWLIVGSIGGLIFVAYARDHGLRGQVRVYALGLVAAAAIYVVLAALGGSVRWVGIEVLGVLVFAGIAALGLGMTPLWLAFGWAVHAVWDAGLHLFRQSGVVGTWYPIACIPFDLIVAVAIVLYAVRADHDSLHTL